MPQDVNQLGWRNLGRSTSPFCGISATRVRRGRGGKAKAKDKAKAKV